MMNPNVQRAQLLYQTQRYDMAAESCRAALGEMPGEPFVHALLGLCLVHMQKYEEATEEARAAIHLGPDFSFGHYALGAIYLERNRFPEAEAAGREAVRLEPENADYWGLLAQAIFAGQRWQETLDAANAGLQYDAQHTVCINLRAMALVKLGDRQGAAASMQEALRRNPHSSLNHANQGWTMLHQNNHKQALEHFREALRIDPNNQWARDGMIQALKAHHLLYRLMLRYYLWMSRFTQRGQWGLIIGFWVGIQVLRAVQAGNPALTPFIYPILGAYVVFVLAGWLADPIFSLSLMASRYGRHLLNGTQRVGSLVVGVLLLGAVVLVPVGYFTDVMVFFGAGLLMMLLTLPTSAAYRCREKSHLIIMTIYAGACAASGVAALGLLILDDPLCYSFVTATSWGCVLSSVASNILGSVIPKK